MWRLISGLLMGWSLGSNDSANIFGTAVASKALKYRTAVITCALFIILGALLEGDKGMHTISGLTAQDMNSAFISSLAAALTVTLMTILRLPVSTSQAVVGAIVGLGLSNGVLNLTGLGRVAACWIGTPLGTILITLLLYPLLGYYLDRMKINIFTRDYILKWGLLAAGAYGAYALGANNVANITGVYVETALLSEKEAVLLGGVMMALGVITYSKKVMITVGSKLVKLDPFTSFIAVLSQAIVVHFYAKMGVPVSTSQAIIGAIIGVGILKGIQTIDRKILGSILIGWMVTPLIAGLISFTIHWAASHLL